MGERITTSLGQALAAWGSVSLFRYTKPGLPGHGGFDRRMSFGLLKRAAS
jgi:hypothetical protein